VHGTRNLPLDPIARLERDMASLLARFDDPSADLAALAGVASRLGERLADLRESGLENTALREVDRDALARIRTLNAVAQQAATARLELVSVHIAAVRSALRALDGAREHGTSGDACDVEC
jgi:hypothetical protein